MQTVAKERGFYVKALSNVYSNYDVYDGVLLLTAVIRYNKD